MKLRNLVTNPSFEVDAAGVSWGPRAQFAVESVATTKAASGERALKLTVSGATQAPYVLQVSLLEAKDAGKAFAASVYCWGESGQGPSHSHLQLVFKSSTGVELGRVRSFVTPLSSGGDRLDVAGVVPSGAVTVENRYVLNGSESGSSAPADGVTFVDAWIAEVLEGSASATTSGHAFLERVDVGKHGVTRVVTPASVQGPVPMILYCHGSGGSDSQFTTGGAWAPFRDALVRQGWGWIEGTGGGLDSWANNAAREAYLAHLAWADSQVNVGRLVVLGRSMGGLIAHWLYGRSPIQGRLSGMILNAAVSTMFIGDTWGETIDRPSATYFSVLRAAYGITSPSGWFDDLKTVTAGHAPEEWDVSTWSGKRILHCFGDADTSVPWSPRGGSYMRDLWAGQPAVDQAAKLVGGDHGASGSYTQVAEMLAFLELPGIVAPSAPRAYFDGDTPSHNGWAYVWDGTPHASTSTATITTIDATLLTGSDPAPVQIVVQDLAPGSEYEIRGHRAGFSWTIPGGKGTSDGSQIVLIDNRAPLNAPITYTLTVSGASISTEPLTVTHRDKFIIQSLDGKTQVEYVWSDNGLPRDRPVNSATFNIPGRRRPVVRYETGNDGGGTLEIRTTKENTHRLNQILETGRPIVLRTDGAVRDLDAVETLLITGASNRLWAGDGGTSTQRVWSLEYLLIDDPEPNTVITAWTWDQFDSVYAGTTWDAFDTEWAGSTWDEFDSYDWGQRLT